MILVYTWMSDYPTGIAPKVWYMTMPSCAVLHIYTSGTWLGKKAGMSAVMSMWLVHIKEHVWTIWICPTTILLPTRYECGKFVALKEDRGRHCPTWDGKPVCSTGSWSGRRWLLLNIKEWQRKELGLSQNKLVAARVPLILWSVWKNNI